MKKNVSRYSWQRSPLPVILLLLAGSWFPVALYAQEDSTGIDTAHTLSRDLQRNTVVMPADSVPAVVTDNFEEEKEKSDSAYFLSKDIAFALQGSDSLQLRRIPDSALRRIKSDAAFWYADSAFSVKKPKEKPDTQRQSFFDYPIVQTLLWVIIIGGFATFVIIYLSNKNVGLFRRSRTIKEEEIEAGETDDIFAINYQRELDKAVAGGNYRMATRLLFLRLLRQLSDRHIIDYKQDRTNFDYLLQLQSSAHYADFFRLTRHYEFTWYGKFDLDAGKFGIINKEFEAFEHKLDRN